MARRLAGLLFLALAVLGTAFGQTQTKQGKTPQPSLQTTRQNLAKKVGSEGFAGLVEASALSLQPREAVALIAEFAPKAPEAKRNGLYALSASISLVLGDYAPAAAALVKAGQGDPDYLLKACRCYLAAGDSVQAEKTLALVPDAKGEASYIDAKRLLSAWSALLSGKPEAAFGLAKGLALGPRKGEERREALLLLWFLASSSDSRNLGPEGGQWPPSEILARLKEDFPGSLELAAAESRLGLRPAAWLLSSVHPPVPVEAERSLAGRPPPDPAGADSDAGRATVQLQVGWFSREDNARNLASSLRSKGFSISVDLRETSAKEKRWAVLVETKGDWSSVQARLKDLGYESYLAP